MAWREKYLQQPRGKWANVGRGGRQEIGGQVESIVCFSVYRGGTTKSQWGRGLKSAGTVRQRRSNLPLSRDPHLVRLGSQSSLCDSAVMVRRPYKPTCDAGRKSRLKMRNERKVALDLACTLTDAIDLLPIYTPVRAYGLSRDTEKEVSARDKKVL